MRFTAKVDRFGTKLSYKGYSEATVLLVDVRFVETGEKATDHIWFAFGKTWEKAGVAVGDTVQFEARVKQYRKGYMNSRAGIDQRKTDYKLSNPTRIVTL